MTLEMQVKKLLGINAVQNIMAKFQYYYTVSDYDAITSLTLAQGATVKAPEGKQLEVTVDGKAAELAAGTITGKIHIAVV